MMVTPNDFLTALFLCFPFYLSLSLCFCEWPISLFHLHRFPFSPLSLSTQLLPDSGRPARWLISPSVPFADKPSGASCEALPSSPNTSVTAQPKQATAMKSVLAGFGAGVSKPPNRSSPAPAAQNAQSANQAPNPASAFSGLVNNISNSAKKEQGSWTSLLLEDFLSVFRPLWSWFLEWTWWDRDVQTRH